MKLFTKNIILPLLFTSSLTQVFSCGVNNSEYGYLSAKVKFPDKAFSVKAIPESTDFILIQVKGENLDKAITFDLHKESPVRIIENIPKGNKNILIKAYDNKSSLVAFGADNIDIIPGILNKVEVTLKENKDLNLKDPCVIFIDPKDMPLSAIKERAFKNAGCEIVLPKDTITNNQVEPSYKPLPSVIFPTPVSTRKPCNIFLSPQDIPLSEAKEKALKDSGCEIIYPNVLPVADPTPTSVSSPIPASPSPSGIISTPTPIPSSYSGGGGSIFIPSEPVNSPSPGLNVEIGVIEGSPLPDDTIIMGE